MNRTAKMDLHGARTATDIERKYNFGKSFAEVMGIATDAQSLAQKAVELGSNLTQEEVFNILTNNGQAQGIFRGDDGEVYINADYIVSLASMFAQDIVMTGTLSCETECYLPPDDEVIETISAHIESGGTIIPAELMDLYDFDGDCEITDEDIKWARLFQRGQFAIEQWHNAVATPVRMTISLRYPEKAIHFTGTNMWGREVEGYWGINFTSARCPATEAWIADAEQHFYLTSHRFDELEARIKALETAQGG